MSTAPLAPTPAPLSAPFEAAIWRYELQARVRNRHGRPPAQDGEAPVLENGTVAARVAERWRAAPSYSELLRASAHAAEQAAFAAEAAAEAARLSSQAAQAAAERDSFADPFFSEPVPTGAPAAAIGECAGEADPWWWAEPPASFAVAHHAPLPPDDPSALAALPPAQGLPAKLIEFPRELVAAWKQRPRLAEGPLLDPEAGAPPRLGEATGEAASAEAVGPSDGFAMADAPSDLRQSAIERRRASFFESAEPAWGAIRLGEHPAPQPAVHTPGPEAAVAVFTGLAPISDRLMAASLDGFIVFAAFLLSVLVFRFAAAHASWGKTGIALAALALAVEAALYGWLFMSFGGGSTPGMRTARIALCTFGDENPSRRELEARVPATALALLPLGLGVFWALLDEDRLGWHDRMTRTYQRTYR